MGQLREKHWRTPWHITYSIHNIQHVTQSQHTLTYTIQLSDDRVWNKQLVGSCHIAQGAHLGACTNLETWDGRVGGRLKREWVYVYTQLVHVIAQQKLTRRCKAILLPLKPKTWKAKKSFYWASNAYGLVHVCGRRRCSCVLCVSMCTGQGSIPGSGRSSGEGNSNSLQYSCLENLMDREAWWAIVRGVAKGQTRLNH